MKSFKIIVILNDGDQVVSNVAAENQAAAVDRLKNTPQFIEFVGIRKIDKIEIAPASEYSPADPKDYVLQKSEKPGHWVVADKKNNLVVVFAEGRYSETAKITFLENPPAALESAPC